MKKKFLILAGLGFLLATPFANAQTAAAPPSATQIRSGQTSGEMAIPVGKSQLLHLDSPYTDIAVGSKDIADVQPLSRNLIYVLGKKNGTTNLTIRGANGSVVAVVDVVVTYDIDGLQERLKELLPDESVSVHPAGDSLVLQGQVSSQERVRQVMAIADHFASGKVTNMLSVGGSQQVLLEMRFAEVDRNALKDLGIDTNLTYAAGLDAVQAVSSASLSSVPFTTATGIFNHGNYHIIAQLNALEQKGLVRTLAQPNLVALSGDTASFLAGGEIPIPINQTNGAGNAIPVVTVEYKEFGVSLNFTPTITGKDFVNLVMNSEVSSLDSSITVTANGFNVPGFKVRRAKTTVEMNDGQSFAIAGLLQDDFTNNVNQMPWLGDIPVLGALLRSSNYQHKQTDLVLIVTVHLVQPTLAKNLATPLDNLVLPTPVEQYGTGKVEGGAAGGAPAQKQGYVLP